jgi:hypothetical protein
VDDHHLVLAVAEFIRLYRLAEHPPQLMVQGALAEFPQADGAHVARAIVVANRLRRVTS